MIRETYCSYEVAKLLKKKGFNEKCRGGYHSEFDDNDNPIVMFEEWMTQPYNNNFVDEGFLCSAPTHQMAMAWLREKDIRICPDYSDVDGKWFTMIGTKKKRTYSGYYDTYEEAIEAALKYSLENLI